MKCVFVVRFMSQTVPFYAIFINQKITTVWMLHYEIMVNKLISQSIMTVMSPTFNVCQISTALCENN